MKKGGFLKFLSELKRRNVYKSALAYIVAGWIILQVQAVTLPSFQLPLSIIKWTVIFLIVAFPFWLVFSWIYELTPEGLKKTVDVDPAESIRPQTGNRLNRIIIGALGIAIALLLFNAFRTSSAGPVPQTESPLQLNLAVEEAKEEDPGKSIAVLAFADMSPQKDQEYFSDGISEEILNLLAQLSDLRVISRTSSFSYKGKDVTVAQIGKDLDVSHVLEGSVRKSGNILRITAQLIQVKDGAHLWSETYDRELEDIFKIQDEIAAEVTGVLKTTLLENSGKSQRVDPKAYELYLRAKYEPVNAEGIKRAQELLKESLALDPTYANAWTKLSYFQLISGISFASIPRSEAFSLARESINMAIRMDPNSASVYNQLAELERNLWNFDKSLSYREKARQLEPENLYIKYFYLLDIFAKPEELIDIIKEMNSRDPLNYSLYSHLSLCLYWENRLEEAGEALKVYETNYPNEAIIHYTNSAILLAQGRNEEALAEAEMEIDPFWKLYAKCFAVYAVGRQKEADALLDELIRKYKDLDADVNIANVYAFRGDADKAFFWLQRALEKKDPTLFEGVFYPTFKLLHNDPRWNELIAKMGVPKGHGIPMGKT